MNDVAIQVENLSKVYTIGLERQRYRTLRDEIVDNAKSLFRRNSQSHQQEETFWALKNVSFEVKHGEVVGIIGRNGAGKSTLLKILSRITEPTEGRAIIRGRVGSLLEVGTGFHGELSGRENIYLNGAILGMKKAEIDRKFDEIVAFSEVENFLDTPVKRYSSGMHVRLAFSVAAHLEPEVLIVDEVLAVGDVAFQKKCIGKMQDVAGQGRTVLFVSHNMTAVQALCPRAVLLRQGRLVLDSQADDAVKEYLSYLSSTAESAFEDNSERSGSGAVRFTGMRILDESQAATRYLEAGKPATLELSYENPGNVKHVHIAVTIFNHLGVAVTNFDSSLTDYVIENLAHKGLLLCRIPCIPFPVAQYRIAIAAGMDGQNFDLIPNALVFEVKGSIFFKTSRTPSLNYCSCMVAHEWSHQIAAN
jgi:lipopolysaccharide transport system ATP-binding protein